MMAWVAPGKDLKERTKQFALHIMRWYRALPRCEDARVIGRQLLGSGTSVGQTIGQLAAPAQELNSRQS
jgi:hypothetical protein